MKRQSATPKKRAPRKKRPAPPSPATVTRELEALEDWESVLVRLTAERIPGKRNPLPDRLLPLVVVALRAGGTLATVANALGVTKAALDKKRQRSELWREALADAKAFKVGVVERNLFVLSKTKPVAGFFLLTNWAPEQYKHRRQLEATVNASKDLAALILESYQDGDAPE